MPGAIERPTFIGLVAFSIFFSPPHCLTRISEMAVEEDSFEEALYMLVLKRVTPTCTGSAEEDEPPLHELVACIRLGEPRLFVCCSRRRPVGVVEPGGQFTSVGKANEPTRPFSSGGALWLPAALFLSQGSDLEVEIATFLLETVAAASPGTSAPPIAPLSPSVAACSRTARSAASLFAASAAEIGPTRPGGLGGESSISVSLAIIRRSSCSCTPISSQNAISRRRSSTTAALACESPCSSIEPTADAMFSPAPSATPASARPAAMLPTVPSPFVSVSLLHSPSTMLLIVPSV